MPSDVASSVLLGRLAFLAVLGIMSAALLIWSWRRDRALGMIVTAALVVYLAGGIAFGQSLQRVHGRDYFAPDEWAFQVEAQRVLDGWRSGQPYVSRIAGRWVDINAAVAAVWGPSLTPMRLVNGVAGAATIAAVYLLAALIFGRRNCALAAACAVFISPSLSIWALTALKERMLGLFIILGLLAIVALVQRWTWSRWALLLATLYVLGELRHYYAPMLGWIAIPSVALFSQREWRLRLVHVIVLVCSIGLVLFLVTGSFLGRGMFQETIVRYVPDSKAPVASRVSDSNAVGYSLQGQQYGHGEPVASVRLIEIVRNLPFVLFGGFNAKAGAGRIIEIATTPEWAMNFLLLPLTLWGAWRALRGHNRLVLIPCAFLAGFALLLAVTFGDDWSTFRFRLIGWPVYLMVGAAVGVDAFRSIRSKVPSFA